MPLCRQLASPSALATRTTFVVSFLPSTGSAGCTLPPRQTLARNGLHALITRLCRNRTDHDSQDSSLYGGDEETLLLVGQDKSGVPVGVSLIATDEPPHKFDGFEVYESSETHDEVWKPALINQVEAKHKVDTLFQDVFPRIVVSVRSVTVRGVVEPDHELLPQLQQTLLQDIRECVRSSHRPQGVTKRRLDVVCTEVKAPKKTAQELMRSGSLTRLPEPTVATMMCSKRHGDKLWACPLHKMSPESFSECAALSFRTEHSLRHKRIGHLDRKHGSLRYVAGRRRMQCIGEDSEYYWRLTFVSMFPLYQDHMDKLDPYYGRPLMEDEVLEFQLRDRQLIALHQRQAEIRQAESNLSTDAVARFCTALAMGGPSIWPALGAPAPCVPNSTTHHEPIHDLPDAQFTSAARTAIIATAAQTGDGAPVSDPQFTIGTMIDRKTGVSELGVENGFFDATQAEDFENLDGSSVSISITGFKDDSNENNESYVPFLQDFDAEAPETGRIRSNDSVPGSIILDCLDTGYDLDGHGDEYNDETIDDNPKIYLLDEIMKEWIEEIETEGDEPSEHR